MPIGDLLAEISGGQPASTSSPKPPVSSGLKRKATDDSTTATSTKLTKARQPDGSYSTSKITRDAQGQVVEQSYSVSRPVKDALPTRTVTASSLPSRTNSPSTNGRYEPPPTKSTRPTQSSDGKVSVGSSNGNNGVRPKDPLNASNRPRPISAATSAAKVPTAKASPTTTDPSRAPKKGSFAEIMARGQKAQATMGKVGMIQHRPIDKGAIKKEREMAKIERKPSVGSGLKDKSSKAYAGNARPSATSSRDNGRPGTSARETQKNGSAKEMKPTGKPKPGVPASDAPEKKVRKSAMPSTYSGTARPRPGVGPDKSSSTGSKMSRAAPRSSRRSKYDEDDEDLDDFIEYDDDEEEDVGRRYRYDDSDGSSDMEAGMYDIDDEERKAESFARLEDRREQALEEKLRREKEERRRRWAQGGR